MIEPIPAPPTMRSADRTKHLSVRAGLRNGLTGSRNIDGGWGYYARKKSRIEPTCWALLALSRLDEESPEVDVLRLWAQSDGVLHDTPLAVPNYAFNAIGAITLLLATPTSPLAERIVRRIIAARGIAGGSQNELRQDNSLRAWPWVDETFSWIEPTAWCLLMLKQRLARGSLSGAKDRIDVGERMLFDRVCHGGGWNYGNSNVLGRALAPYVPTTAVALLALQDKSDETAVRGSLHWLQQNALNERSAVALSLSIVCLRSYGVSTEAYERELLNFLDQRRSLGGDDVLGTAMALYALTDGPMTAFAIPQNQ